MCPSMKMSSSQTLHVSECAAHNHMHTDGERLAEHARILSDVIMRVKAIRLVVLCSHMAVISSRFHMPRVQSIFSHCFSLAPRAMSLEYHAVMDDDLFAEDVLQARQSKEATSLQVMMLYSSAGRACVLETLTCILL